jgi:hypothetical protein
MERRRRSGGKNGKEERAKEERGEGSSEGVRERDRGKRKEWRNT